jgi:heat shock protein HtpX
MPEAMVETAVAPWALALLFYLAPMLGSLLQLALARAREYDADLEAAKLTGDPAALASALQKLERLRGHLRQGSSYRRRIFQRISFLRSHPPTEKRVRRLLALHQPAQSASWIPPQAALKRIPDGMPRSETIR